MFDIDDIRGMPVLSNSLTAWLIASCIAAGTLLVLFVVRRFIRSSNERLRATTRIELFEIPMLVLSRTTAFSS